MICRQKGFEWQTTRCGFRKHMRASPAEMLRIGVVLNEGAFICPENSSSSGSAGTREGSSAIIVISKALIIRVHSGGSQASRKADLWPRVGQQ